MVQRGSGLRFLLEASKPFRVIGNMRRKDLQRDIPIQARIAGAIHLAHTARADGCDNFVRTECDT